MYRFKNITPFILLFFIGYFILCTIISTITNQKIESLLHLEIDKLQTHYNININHEKEIAESVYMYTSSNKEIIRIFSEAWKTKDKIKQNQLRKQLLSLLDEKYNTMKNLGVLQYHFVFPNNVTFLRMHKPSKFGDDLTAFRSDFKYVNQYKKIVRGLSPGKTAHAFRNIYPLYDSDNNYIGCVDIAFPSERLQNQLTIVSDLHSHFLINKNVLDIKLWERDDIQLKYQKSAEHVDYLLTMTNSHKKKYCIVALKEHLKEKKDFIKESFSKGESFSFYTRFIDSINLISFIPIKDNMEGKVIAWLVSYVEDKDNLLASFLDLDLLLKVVSFFVLGAILFFFFNILNQKRLLAKEVRKKTKELEDINRNLESKVNFEVDKNLKQQLQLFEQSKMATMGAMIGNIAHQWRQPLSVISTTATTISFQHELSMLDNDLLPQKMEIINNQVNYLSETIDTFRNFLKEKKELKEVVLQDRINVALSIVSVALRDNNINLIKNINQEPPIKVTLIIGELSQVIINIINNARDILLEKNIDEPWVKIELLRDEQFAYITIEDNGGGIPDAIIDKIFDEYFTTKDDIKGTGLGLYMSKKILQESLHGDLTVQNSTNGALFTIKLSL